MNYTPRQVAAYQYFVHRRTSNASATDLLLGNMAAHGKPSSVRLAAKKMSAE